MNELRSIVAYESLCFFFRLNTYIFGILKIKRFFMVRVVESISDQNVGGAGILLLNKIKNMDSKKFDIIVLLPKGSLLSKRFKSQGTRVIEIDGCKNKSFDLKSLLAYVFVIRRLLPDIVNSHGCMNSRIAGRAVADAVNIYTRHCDFPVEAIYRNPLVKCVVRIFNSAFSDGIIAVSFSARKNLISLGVRMDQIKVIINGAEALKRTEDTVVKDLKRALNIPADAIVVGIFSRLEPYKDHVTFLRAAKLLMNNANCYFIVVGGGSCENALKSFAKRLGILEKVRFCGFVEEVTPYMNITDINVNCSVGTETSSLALSEGMSLGIPAIVSDYPGNLYMVRDGINGIVYKQGEYRALARAVERLMSDRELYLRLSRNSRLRFDSELNAAKMARDTEDYYLSLLKKKKPSGGRPSESLINLNQINRLRVCRD